MHQLKFTKIQSTVKTLKTVNYNSAKIKQNTINNYQTIATTFWKSHYAVKSTLMCTFIQINRYMKYTDYTSLNPCSTAHLLKCSGKCCLYLKSLAHKPQQNSLTSECLRVSCFNSIDVQKHFRHSLDTKVQHAFKVMYIGADRSI